MYLMKKRLPYYSTNVTHVSLNSKIKTLQCIYHFRLRVRSRCKFKTFKEILSFVKLICMQRHIRLLFSLSLFSLFRLVIPLNRNEVSSSSSSVGVEQRKNEQKCKKKYFSSYCVTVVEKYVHPHPMYVLLRT